MKLGGKEVKLLVISCLTTFIIITNNGCSKENPNDKRIPDSYFTIDTDIKDYNSGQYSGTVFELDAGVGLLHHYYYLGFEKDHVCWDLQFLYPNNNSNYIVKIRRFDDGKFRAFFVRFENGPIAYKTFMPEFTVYTNLDRDQFMQLFPSHTGKVIKENVNSIEINKHFYRLCWDMIWRFESVSIIDSTCTKVGK
jgi:hypothetical protein